LKGGEKLLNEELLKKMQRIKPEISNEVTDKGYVLTLSGRVSKNYWEDDDNICVETIDNELKDVEGDITIRLNSGGGDVFEGIEIYNYLKSLDNHITIEVTALAASAASIIAMAGDEIKMCTGSSMMVHEASTIAWGNKSDIQKVLNSLDTIDDSLVSIYAERTGADKETINSWIEEETWFTADEAIEVGLADGKREKETNDVATINVDAEKIAEMVMNQFEQKYAAMLQPKQQEPKQATGLNKLFNKKGE
jgi:ATP-dependent Clp protease, protease subunit